jgi:uncharacterized protein YkwD
MKFIYILLTFISLQSIAQTKLDSLILDEINRYRLSKNISMLQLSTENFKSANHHTIYLSKIENVCHTEDTLVTTLDRYKFYGGKSLHVAENVTKVNLNIRDTCQTNLDIIAKKVVDSWINSKGHNRILLSDSKFAGVSTLYDTKKIGIKGWSNICVTSTLVVSW